MCANVTKLAEIQGIGETYSATLQGCGLTTQAGLLEKSATPAGRKPLVDESGISNKLILKWVNHADLAHVKGMGGEYADLLESAGVDTVPELATRNAANLHAKLAEVNEEKNLVRALPAQSMVAGWVEQDGGLERAVHY
jgi:predicted flap endonuclease-1-like 5' DNA nuclease